MGSIKLKIILVSGKNPFKAEPSGTLAYIAGLANALSDKKMDVTLLSTDIGSEQQKRNIKHIPIKMRRATSIVFLLKLMVKTPFMRLSKNSIIHAHRPDFMFPFVFFHRKNPKVCTLHGIPNLGIKTRKNAAIWGIYNIIERSTLNRIDKLIAVNHSTKEYYIGKNPRLKGKIIVIPVGIDLELFKPKDRKKMRDRYGFAQDEFIILFIGRFSQEKGLELLLSGFSELKADMPKARLILLGKGPQESKLRKIVKDEGIRDVTFMEPLSHEKIPEIINCAQVLALCSYYEGIPTVVLEALACGVPVVSTDVGDVKKAVINDKTGELILNRSSQSVKDAILKVVRRGSETYRDECTAEARRYSWENIYNNIFEVYNEVAKEVKRI